MTRQSVQTGRDVFGVGQIVLSTPMELLQQMAPALHVILETVVVPSAALVQYAH